MQLGALLLTMYKHASPQVLSIYTLKGSEKTLSFFFFLFPHVHQILLLDTRQRQ